MSDSGPGAPAPPGGGGGSPGGAPPGGGSGGDAGRRRRRRRRGGRGGAQGEGLGPRPEGGEAPRERADDRERGAPPADRGGAGGGERRGPPGERGGGGGGERRGPPGDRGRGGERRGPPGDRGGAGGGERRGPPGDRGGAGGGERRGPPGDRGGAGGGERRGPPGDRGRGERRGPPDRGGERRGRGPAQEARGPRPEGGEPTAEDWADALPEGTGGRFSFAAPRKAAPAPAPLPEPEPEVPREPYFLRARTEDPEEVEFADFDFTPGALFNELAVRFVAGGRVVRCDAADMVLRRGELVMVDLDRSLVLATVVVASRRRWGRSPTLRVARRANEADQRGEADLRRREQGANRTCGARVRALDLPAKLVRTELSPSGRITCYLASEEKLDLRELARELTRDLAADRIELRQIGIRDSTKVLGGVGPCGLQLCCNTFLQDFAPVSIRHAKDQALVLNPAKISGVCGRLMCCLVYEEAFYRANRKLLPKIGKRVMTPHGEGRVRDVDVLKQTARIELADPAAPSRIVEVRAGEIQAIAPPQGPGQPPAGPADEPDEPDGEATSGESEPEP